MASAEWLADEHLIGGDGAAAMVDAQRGGCVVLRVVVYDEDLEAMVGKCRSDVDGGGRLADAALLVCDADTARLFGQAVTDGWAPSPEPRDVPPLQSYLPMTYGPLTIPSIPALIRAPPGSGGAYAVFVRFAGSATVRIGCLPTLVSFSDCPQRPPNLT